MDDLQYVLNPQTTIRLGLENLEPRILVGEGSERSEFICEQSEMVTWLLYLRTPVRWNEVINLAVEKLEIERDDAVEIVEGLIQSNIIVRYEKTLVQIPHTEKKWEQWGWRDALDFHRATRDLLWRRDYSSNPEVMTWYFNDQLILPETPAPVPSKKNQNWLKVNLLPESDALDSVQFGETLYKRRTSRKFNGQTVSAQKFSDLLKHSFSLVGRINGRPYRVSPSYSLGSHFEVYPVLVNVEGYEPGVYYYNSLEHDLFQLSTGNFSQELLDVIYGQVFMRNVSFALFYTVNWSQYMWKYRYSRSYRLALFEIAAIVQASLICAAGLGLKTFLTPAINDLAAVKLLQIEDEFVEAPLYVVGIGL